MSASNRLQEPQEVVVVHVVVPVFFGQDQVSLDVGSAEGDGLLEGVDDAQENGIVPHVSALVHRSEERLNGVHRGNVLLSKVITVDPHDLLFDLIIEAAWEYLLEAVLHGDHAVDVGCAVEIREELVKALHFVNLLLQHLDLEHFASDCLKALLRGVREVGLALFWLDASHLVHLSDERKTFLAILGVWIKL